MRWWSQRRMGLRRMSHVMQRRYQRTAHQVTPHSEPVGSQMGKTQKMGCHAFSGVPGAPRKWNSAAMTPRATMANTQSGTSRRRKRVYITRRMPSFSSE